MHKICDLHIHSKFSGGASKNIDIFKIAYNCNIKGVNTVGTGDCLHPMWLSELFNNLIEAIQKVRKSKFWFIPGHDAVYGKLQFEN